MKKIQQVLLQTCVFTVVISLLFYIIGAILKENVLLPIDHYLVFALLGFLVALAGLILDINKLMFIFRFLLHYGVLLGAFIAFLFIGDFKAMERSSAVFVAIIIFTFFYILICFAAWGIKKLVVYLDKKLDRKLTSIKKSSATSKLGNKKKEEYKPRFK